MLLEDIVLTPGLSRSQLEGIRNRLGLTTPQPAA